MQGKYKGDITPPETWTILANDKKATLVDVRTFAEWKCVGVTNLSSLGKDGVYIEWVNFPEGAPNINFIKQLEEVLPEKDTPIYFLCRTGVRSVGAAIAATDAGYENCYNILEGFEGGPDENGHRGRVSGWQGRGLPWKH